MILATPRHFSFAECLTFLNRSHHERLHYVENGRLRKAIRTKDHTCLVELSSPNRRELKVAFINGTPSPAQIRTIKHFIQEWFDLETDLSPFYELATRDRILGSLVSKYHGLRLMKIDNLFQALCWAILGQQVNLTFAYTLYRRFIESFGEKFDFLGEAYWFFPDPKIISELKIEDLRKLQLTGKKAEYIIGLAKLMVEGSLSKAQLLQLGSFEGALKALTQLHGVGLWTANYVLMRCLGFKNAFPIQDIGLHRAIQLQLGADRKPTIDEIHALAVGWTDWEAYATFYLYRSLL